MATCGSWSIIRLWNTPASNSAHGFGRDVAAGLRRDGRSEDEMDKTLRGLAASLVAPNIFDAHANANLLLYLVFSNLLSPATWEFSERIKQRMSCSAGGGGSPCRLAAAEIQQFINRNFQHLHAADVARLHGELQISAERQRLGEDKVDQAMRQIIQTMEARIASGAVPAEALQPTIDRSHEGFFPAYVYGNIDLVRANRKLKGKSHASVKGLTSCVDEAALFASLAMTMPAGTFANVVALAGPSHTTAFGWSGDGEPWWFYGKNRLYFPEDWQDQVAQRQPLDVQAVFDELLADVSRVVSAAGTFNLETGEANLPDAHIDEIVAKMDQFFGIRLRQIEAARLRPRKRCPEDPLAPYLRELLGTSSIEHVLQTLGASDDAACQLVLYAFRSLLARDLGPYLDSALAQPNCRALARTLKTMDEAIGGVAGIAETESIFGDRDRIAMPDETLRFRAGTDRDKALLLHALIAHMDARDENHRLLATLLGERMSFVQIGSQYVDAGTGQFIDAPSQPILFTLA